MKIFLCDRVLLTGSHVILGVFTSMNWYSIIPFDKIPFKTKSNYKFSHLFLHLRANEKFILS